MIANREEPPSGSLSGQLEASALVPLVAFVALSARRFVRNQPQHEAIIIALHAWTALADEWLKTTGFAAAERQAVLRHAQTFVDEVTFSRSRHQWDGTERRQPQTLEIPPAALVAAWIARSGQGSTQGATLTTAAGSPSGTGVDPSRGESGRSDFSEQIFAFGAQLARQQAGELPEPDICLFCQHELTTAAEYPYCSRECALNAVADR